MLNYIIAIIIIIITAGLLYALPKLRNQLLCLMLQYG